MRVIIFIIIISIGILSESFANDYSDEANYIFRNKVSISRIDSFLFKGTKRKGEMRFVALTLIGYNGNETKILLKKMLNDSSITLQSLSIIPLINIGEFIIAFSKLKELVKQNQIEVLINFYEKNQAGYFHDLKIHLIRKYKKQFIPFIKDICKDNSIIYEIKLKAANTLYYLGEKGELKKVCNEILEKIHDPKIDNKEYNDCTEKEKRYWHLRRRAKHKLDNMYEKK